MKIAYVTLATIPSFAANGVQSAKMCDAFSELGNEVVLLSSGQGTEPASSGIHEFYGLRNDVGHKCVPWPRNGPGQGYRYALRAALMARKMDPDLIYTRSLRVALIASLLGQRTILELHDVATTARMDDAIAFKLLCRLPSLGGIVLISQALRTAVESRFPESTSHCRVAHDAASTPPPLRELRVPLSDSKRTIVGYVGGLYEGKGLDVILGCAQRLSDFEFHVAGRVPPEVAMAVKDAPDNLHLHGFVQPACTDAFRSNCDILLAPYGTRVAGVGGSDIARWMSPLKIFEYMAAGRPIVASDLPVIREVLKHEETALLCPPRDIDLWCAALKRLDEDRSLARELAGNALAEFQDRYTYTARARSVLGCLAG